MPRMDCLFFELDFVSFSRGQQNNSFADVLDENVDVKGVDTKTGARGFLK